jgi:FHA domain
MSHITQIADRLTPQISLETTLQDLIQELDPLTKTASLYALNQTSSQSIGQIAGNLDGVSDPLLQETIDRVLKRPIAPNMIPTLTLDLELSGHKDRRVYRKSIVRVGRASDNDLVILDEGVSRYHAVLKVDASGMMVLQDLRSQYGLRFGSTHLRDGESMIANSTKIYLSPNDDLAIEAHLSMTASTEQPITTLEKLLWLRSSPLFQSLHHQNLLAIARNSSLIIYNQGDVLCQAGETAFSLLLLIAGTAQSDRHTFAGGEVIGEVGILTQTTYSNPI